MTVVVSGVTLTAIPRPRTAIAGKNVVLYFYPKDGTPGCTIEAHNFQRDQPQYAQRNAVVVGVSVDTTDSHKEFCSKEGLNFKLLADTEHKVVKQYESTMNYKGVEIAARNTFGSRASSCR